MNDLELTALKEGSHAAWGIYADYLEERNDRKATLARRISLVPDLETGKLVLRQASYGFICIEWDSVWTVEHEHYKPFDVYPDYQAWINRRPSHPYWVSKSAWDAQNNWGGILYNRPEDVPGLLEARPDLVWQFYMRLLVKHKVEMRKNGRKNNLPGQ